MYQVWDIYFQNWNTGGHFKLLQKSVKIQYIFQKFVCTVDGHDRNDFWIQKKFGSGHFFIFFQISWIEKMPRAKKVINIKNQFFHARQPREEIFDICSHRCIAMVYFYTFLSELQIAPTTPILGVSVRNLVQGHLRTYSLLIRLKFRIPIKVELY